MRGPDGSARVMLLSGGAILAGLALLVGVRFGVDDPDVVPADRVEAVGPGLETTTTDPSEPFVLAAPVDNGAPTTLANAPVPSTTTEPAATTTIPTGLDSQDGVCRAMGAVYAVSNTEAIHGTGRKADAALADFRRVLSDVARAVDESPSQALQASRAEIDAVFARADSLLASGELIETYAALTDPNNPPAFIAHLQRNCPDVGTLITKGRGG